MHIMLMYNSSSVTNHIQMKKLCFEIIIHVQTIYLLLHGDRHEVEYTPIDVDLHVEAGPSKILRLFSHHYCCVDCKKSW